MYGSTTIARAVRGVLVAAACAPALVFAQAGQTPGTRPPAARGSAPEVGTLGEITVEGRRDTGYRQTTTDSVLRAPGDIADLAVSVQVIPAEVLQDQAAISLRDAYRNVSGVQTEATDTYASNRESAFIRGFLNLDLNRNGIPTRSVGSVDLAVVESVDVLKGPAGVTYGQVEPGGLINFTTKRPRRERFTVMELRGGSYGFKRGMIDTTGPIDDDGMWSYRLVGAYQDRESYRQFVESESYVVAPSLTFRPSDALEITAEFSKSEVERVWDEGIPFPENGAEPASIRTFYGDPSFRPAKLEDEFATVDARYWFTDSLSLRTVLVQHEYSNRFETFRHNGVFTDDSGVERLARRYEIRDEFTTKEDQVYSMLSWVGRTGAVGHSLSLAADYRSVDVVSRRRRDDRSVDISAPLGSPTYGFDRSSVTLRTEPASISDLRTFGVSIQDQMSLADDRLKLLLAARIDDYDATGEFFVPTEASDRETSVQVGALYKLRDDLSVYASYAESFNLGDNVFYTDRNNETLPPMLGEQVELGLKASLLDESLTLTASVYELKKTNTPIYVFDETFAPSYYYYEAAGELRSRGFELDVVGALTERLNVIASYGYTDAEVIKASSLERGTPLRMIPRHSASLWLDYNLPVRWFGLEGKFGLGGGVFHLASRPGDDAASFELPSQTQVDLAVSYELKFAGGRAFVTRLNVANVFDERLYVAAFDRATVMPGSPTSATLSLGVKF